MAQRSSMFQVLKMSFIAPLTLLAVNGNAIATAQTSSDPSDRSVVVDTEGDRQTSTNRSSTSITSATRFSCQPLNGQYTVVYQPESHPGQFFAWAKPVQLGGGWTPQSRCNEIARRLETYRPDGLLEMTTSQENGYNTVCVTTEKVPGCRIVFTVPPGQDPVSTRDRVFENLTVADSGQQTDAINTFTNRGNDGITNLWNRGREILGGKFRPQSKNINLQPFLDRKDGGTGSQLQGGVQLKQSKSNQLNPANFR